MTESDFILVSQSLSELSQIETCKRLWTHFDIKKSIKSQLQQNDTNVNQPELLNQLFENIEKLNIPDTIKNDLKPVAKGMGDLISMWLQHLYNKDDLPVDMGTFMDYIEWTDIGGIDTAETTRSMYFAGIFPDSKNTWLWLTRHCLADCIEDYAGKSEYLKTGPELSDILQIYWRRKIENKLEDFLPDLELGCRPNGCLADFPQSESGIMSLLPIYVLGENVQGIKYFWQFLTDDQRIVYIKKALYFWSSRKNDDIQIFRFIYYQVSRYEKVYKNLPIETYERMFKIMKYWPYEDLLRRTLKKYGAIKEEFIRQVRLMLDEMNLQVRRRMEIMGHQN